MILKCTVQELIVVVKTPQHLGRRPCLDVRVFVPGNVWKFSNPSCQGHRVVGLCVGHPGKGYVDQVCIAGPLPWVEVGTAAVAGINYPAFRIMLAAG